MYVLVRNDLTEAQKAVQGGHALAEYLLKKKHDWNNSTLIYLGVRDKEHLEKWKYKLEKHEILCSIWREPDMNNEITSIAAYAGELLFRKLNCI